MHNCARKWDLPNKCQQSEITNNKYLRKDHSQAHSFILAKYLGAQNGMR